MLHRIALAFFLVLLWPVGILGSAALAAEPPGGLVLPPGDPMVGRLAFVKMQCNHCHMITGKRSEGISLPVAATPAPLLNADVAKKGQAELVTSVLNPSHVIELRADQKEGKLSPMGDYTHALTVRELIDLIAFLQAPEETSTLPKAR
jgi:L-cysteine S-thiosulfotransferase